jgi:hypothetical protein
MRVAIWTPRRNGHAGHAAGLEQHRPRFGEHRIPIVDQMARVSQKSVCRIEKISGNLFHPIAVRGDADPGDLHGAGIYAHDEEHHVADGPEHAQDFDAEEIARVQRLPVALEEVRPGPFAIALRRRLEAGVRKDAGDGAAADLDLQPLQRIANFRVPPTPGCRAPFRGRVGECRSPCAAGRLCASPSCRIYPPPVGETRRGSSRGARSGSRPYVPRQSAACL